jgi:hypothetical protein
VVWLALFMGVVVGVVLMPLSLYAEELGKPDYILGLLLSVIAVSVKTVDVVRGLPELNH